MTKNEQQHKPLDQEAFNAIASAFARLQMLGDKSLTTGPGDNSQQEREKLIEYLATEMMANIAEFLGSWQLCNLEYLPALRAIQAVAKRAGYLPAPLGGNSKNPGNPERN